MTLAVLAVALFFLFLSPYRLIGIAGLAVLAYLYPLAAVALLLIGGVVFYLLQQPSRS